MPRFLALVTITVAVVSSFHVSATEPAVVDRNSLLSFKSGVQGNLSDWGSHRMWTWSGVTCDSRGRVISLVHPAFNLTGVISPAIGNLSALEVLDLSGNQLSGSIPPELGKLSQLGYLSLDNRGYP
jgi:Leucine-rich repeat (LRR) protein